MSIFRDPSVCNRFSNCEHCSGTKIPVDNGWRPLWLDNNQLAETLCWPRPHLWKHLHPHATISKSELGPRRTSWHPDTWKLDVSWPYLVNKICLLNHRITLNMVKNWFDLAKQVSRKSNSISKTRSPNLKVFLPRT